MTQPVPRHLNVTAAHLASVSAEAPLRGDADDILCMSEGYLVDAGAGVLGVVEEVVFDGLGHRAEFLMVRRDGPNRQRAVEVPVESVVEIRPAERRVVLGGHWQRNSML